MWRSTPKILAGQSATPRLLPADDLVTAARRLASPTILAFALAISAEIGWWSGQWTTAYADATEALQLATDNGQPGLLAYGLSMLARIEAARGERESCQARVDQVQREVEPRGVGCVAIYGYASLGLPHLAPASYTTPPRRLQHAWDLGSASGHGQSQRVPHRGRPRGSLGTRWRIQQPCIRSRLAGRTSPGDRIGVPQRSRGLPGAGNPGDRPRRGAAPICRVPRRTGQGRPIAFEQARTLLCSGEAIRRNRRPAAARVPLRALALFDGLGARPCGSCTGRTRSLGREKPARPLVVVRPKYLRNSAPRNFRLPGSRVAARTTPRWAASVARVPQDGRGASDEGLPQARDPITHRTGPDPPRKRNR